MSGRRENVCVIGKGKAAVATDWGTERSHEEHIFFLQPPQTTRLLLLAVLPPYER